MIDFGARDVVVCLASAGAGKTTQAMKELTKQLRIFRPEEIAFVTFTRKGVAQGLQRAINASQGLSEKDFVHFKTLNSICFREAGLGKKNILTQKNMCQFNSHFGFNLTGRSIENKPTKDDKLLQAYNIKRTGSFVEDIEIHDHQRYDVLVDAYEEFKRLNNIVDFADCFTKYLEVGKPIEELKVCLVDEAQDLTPVQWQCIEKLTKNCQTIRIYGDDYQALYTYAGADPQILIDLSYKYPTIKLEKSYRLSQEVYHFAKKITSVMQTKVDKDYIPVKKVRGAVTSVNDKNIVFSIVEQKLSHTEETIMLLFRTNYNIDKTTEKLKSLGIPYTTDKGFCVSVKLLNRIKRFCKFRDTDFGSQAVRKDFMKKYGIKSFYDPIFKTNICGNSDYDTAVYLQNLLDTYGLTYLLRESEAVEPRLLLSTVHKVKGGEADNVVYFLDASQQVTRFLTKSPDVELRIFYVACTRAKLNFFIVKGSTTHTLNQLSDFIMEQ